MKTSSRIALKFVLPVVVLSGSAALTYWMLQNPPAPKKFSARPQSKAISVSTQILNLESYPVNLKAFGVVQPAVMGSLVAQVSGVVVETFPSFETGGAFKKDTVLLELDDRDYQAELILAKAGVANSELALQEMQSRSEQAESNWQRLQNGMVKPERTPSPLVLLKPQLKAAKAELQAAKATVTQRQLDLERTRIKAPYAGRVISAQVDVGQYVNVGQVLGEIYSNELLEIKFPLSENQLQWLNIPQIKGSITEIKKQLSSLQKNDPGRVNFSVMRQGRDEQWFGKITHSAVQVNETNRQLDVIATVDPALQNSQLVLGEFVEVSVFASELKDVFIIPRQAIYDNAFVMIVVDERLQQREIEMVWQSDEVVIVKKDHLLKEGDELVITPLGQLSPGTAVKVVNPETESQKEQELKPVTRPGRGLSSNTFHAITVLQREVG